MTDAGRKETYLPPRFVWQVLGVLGVHIRGPLAAGTDAGPPIRTRAGPAGELGVPSDGPLAADAGAGPPIRTRAGPAGELGVHSDGTLAADAGADGSDVWFASKRERPHDDMEDTMVPAAAKLPHAYPRAKGPYLGSGRAPARAASVAAGQGRDCPCSGPCRGARRLPSGLPLPPAGSARPRHG